MIAYTYTGVDTTNAQVSYVDHKIYVLIRECESPRTCKGSGYPFFKVSDNSTPTEYCLICDRGQGGCSSSFPRVGELYEVGVGTKVWRDGGGGGGEVDVSHLVELMLNGGNHAGPHHEGGISHFFAPGTEGDLRMASIAKQQLQEREERALLQAQAEQRKREQKQAAEQARAVEMAREYEAKRIAHLHLKIVNAKWVTLGRTDANGYRHQESRPIQRLVAVSVESKGQSRFDILCYGTYWSDGSGSTTQVNSCPVLEVGKTYLMDVGGKSVERDIPNTNKRVSWQVLELCNPEPQGCQQVSTLADRH